MAMTPSPPDPMADGTVRASRSSGMAGPLSVSQVTAMVADAITSSLPTSISVVGEISNFKRHGSGHLYLTLKDKTSELSCVMWRSAAANLKFVPSDGMMIVATGHVAVFERSGRYQLYIRRLEPRGVGELELAFRQLCERLRREGLFDAARKRPIPAFPRRVAVVTSATGAAVVDILRTLTRRFPCVDVLLYPVAVQGSGAAPQIARAISQLNRQRHRLGGVDVMIVGRGGGSLEDLWAFNEEVVARAIFASTIPVISAVGHEVDVTIADLVADLRAATPTAAAELAVPVLEEVLRNLEMHQARLERVVSGRIELAGVKLAGAARRSLFREPLTMVHRREQLVDEAVHRVWIELDRQWQQSRRRLETLERVVQRIAPHACLLRQATLVHRLERRLHWSATRRFHQVQQALQRSVHRVLQACPAGYLPELASHVARLERAMPMLLHHKTALLATRVRGQQERLTAMGYRSVIRRGFSITRIKRGGKVIRSVRALRDRDRVVTELSDGSFESEVLNLHQLELFD